MTSRDVPDRADVIKKCSGRDVMERIARSSAIQYARLRREVAHDWRLSAPLRRIASRDRISLAQGSATPAINCSRGDVLLIVVS